MQFADSTMLEEFTFFVLPLVENFPWTLDAWHVYSPSEFTISCSALWRKRPLNQMDNWSDCKSANIRFQVRAARMAWP
jgi:hypothetical protein